MLSASRKPPPAVHDRLGSGGASRLLRNMDRFLVTLCLLASVVLLYRCLVFTGSLLSLGPGSAGAGSTTVISTTTTSHGAGNVVTELVIDRSGRTRSTMLTQHNGQDMSITVLGGDASPRSRRAALRQAAERGRMASSTSPNAGDHQQEHEAYPGLPQDFDAQAYLMYHPDLRLLGIHTADQAKQHYLQQGREEGRPYKRLRVLLRYTACTGLINQHYSHIAAFTLAAALGAEVVLPPAVCRDSFAHYFSMNREKNEVRWSPVPLESLLDVDAIIAYWRPRGLVVHRTPALRPFPDLTMPDIAFPQYPLGSLDPNLVVRLENVYLKNLNLTELMERGRAAVVGHATSILRDDPAADLQYIVLDMPCSFFALRSLSNLPVVTEVAKSLLFAPELQALADRIIDELTEGGTYPYNGLHLLSIRVLGCRVVAPSALGATPMAHPSGWGGYVAPNGGYYSPQAAQGQYAAAYTQWHQQQQQPQQEQPQWQGHTGSWGAQQYVGQPAPPPPAPPSNTQPPDAAQPPLPPSDTNAAAGWYDQAYGSWPQQQQQQYGGYPNYHATQQHWDYYSAQGNTSQGHGGWQQPSGYDSYRHAGSWQASDSAPPPGPAPAASAQPKQQQEQNQYSASIAHDAAPSAGVGGAAPAQQQQHVYQQAYTAVPPPASISQSTTAGVSGRRTFSIRPQMPKAKPPDQSNPLVAAFNQAAAKLSTGVASAAPAAPAYTRVQLGVGAGSRSQQQQQATAVNPQQWPPALKSYVERAFKACDVRQRSKLQEILKKVIGDAQVSGELWTRDWEAMPLPDLSQSATDAASLLAEVAAVAGPATGTAVNQAAGRHGWAWSSAALSSGAQQQYASQRMPAGRQAHRPRLDTEDRRYGRKGWKRSYRDDHGSESPRSDSEDEQWSYAERQRRKRRAGRFANQTGSRSKSDSGSWKSKDRRQELLTLLEQGDEEELDWDSLAIKGTCQDLEKSYFRLTSAPDAATVRPEHVLRSALDRLVGLLRAREVQYFYALDQFKGMRQDCTVQHIRNELAVQVYEAHARAALEYGDMSEYNQCQSQLNVLYSEGVPGCRSEFLSYRVLYQAVHAKHGEILQLLNTLKTIKPAEAALPDVAHALSVREALAAADYPRFFRLYATAPRLGQALMDIIVPILRFDGLQAVCKAFKPSVPLPFLARLLGFVSAGIAPTGKSVSSEPREPSGAAAAAVERGGPLPGQGGDTSADGTTAPPPGCMYATFEGEYAAQVDMVEGCRDCIEWLAECDAVVLDAETPTDAAFDCKASAGQLKMPSQKPAVAHADANLGVEDFLKQVALPGP